MNNNITQVKGHRLTENLFIEQNRTELHLDKYHEQRMAINTEKHCMEWKSWQNLKLKS